MTAQQSDALREIANKARVTTILQCKAWKDTQRILKRSGLVCRERSEPFDPEKHFDCYTVRYLYLLNIMALELKSDTRIKVEVFPECIPGFRRNQGTYLYPGIGFLIPEHFLV